MVGTKEYVAFFFLLHQTRRLLVLIVFFCAGFVDIGDLFRRFRFGVWWFLGRFYRVITSSIELEQHY